MPLAPDASLCTHRTAGTCSGGNNAGLPCTAPDGTLAAYCIAWLDPWRGRSRSNPLGTRPEFRRLGIGRAIVDEVVRRAAERDAASVLAWGTGTNPIAVHLYESAGFSSRRVLREYRRAG